MFCDSRPFSTFAIWCIRNDEALQEQNILNAIKLTYCAFLKYNNHVQAHPTLCNERNLKSFQFKTIAGRTEVCSPKYDQATQTIKYKYEVQNKLKKKERETEREGGRNEFE